MNNLLRECFGTLFKFLLNQIHSGALNERSAITIMKKDKLMLVLRIVQCLQGKIDVRMTTFKSIPYVLHCCGIDLGFEFKSSQNCPYSLEFDQLVRIGNEGLYITQRCGSTKLVNVTNKFDISNYHLQILKIYFECGL